MKARSSILAAAALGLAGSLAAQPATPAPKLYLTGLERYAVRGSSFIRFKYDVLNKSAFPAELFKPAPQLPPCGKNAQSSRSWVDFFEAGTDKRIYGFCALGAPTDLGSIWFALPEGTAPPKGVYITIVDRQTNSKYTSNVEIADPFPRRGW